MRFKAYDDSLANADVLSVDGVTPTGPNLSHWPGNRTPAALRADTSTEIVLKAVSREGGLGALARDLVTNNHFDSDGVLSVYAALHPAFAREHSALFVDTAWAGDLVRFTSRQAVILDLCIAGLNEHPASPIAKEIAGIAKHDFFRLERAYSYALEHLPDLIKNPEPLRLLWEEGVEKAEEGLQAFNEGTAKVVAYEPLVDLAVIVANAPLAPLAFRTRAPRARTLLAVGRPGRFAYTLRDEIETWFDMETIKLKRAQPLGPLQDALNALDVAEWQLHDSDALLPSLTCSPSRLSLEEVVKQIVKHLGPRGT